VTVAEALAQARARGLDRLDAQLLLGHVLGQPRSWLLAHGEETLASASADRLAALVERRAAGVPIAYLIGQKEFHGLMLNVDARVLVPRPETELLVDWALERLRGDLARIARPAVVDLGTGSGAIALAVKHGHGLADVVAVDRSAEALDVARRNAQDLGLDVELALGSWWQPLNGRRFDLALSNPPYVAGDDPHLKALRHEPDLALTPGPIGLEALTAIVGSAASHLNAGGWLLLEHGHDQGPAVAELLVARGFEAVETRCDLAGQARCTGGRL
jgi:release factor glutamine methyltransferase